MDREGSSMGKDDGRDEFQQPEGPPPQKVAKKDNDKGLPNKEDQPDPEDTDDEEVWAEIAGAKNYQDKLWDRLRAQLPKGQWNIDVLEIKMMGECLHMKITAEGNHYDQYFAPRSTEDFKLRKGFWIPRAENLFKCFRTRLYSLPKTCTIHKLIFFNTPNCEAEDCFIEFMFIKKWQCKLFEYNIVCEFSQPEHLRKMIHMFKPIDIQVFLSYGPYIPPANGEPGGMHNHLAALADGRIALEKDFRVECTAALNNAPNLKEHTADPSKKELSHLYTEAAKGKEFGMEMLRTMNALKKFVSMMVEKRMAQTKGMNVRKFIIKWAPPSKSGDPPVSPDRLHDYSGPTRRVNLPTVEKMCPKLAALLKDDGQEEATKKRAAYAAGEKMFVCVRQGMGRQYKYSISMPVSSFKMAIDNELFLHYTSSIANFQCLFRTTVDEHGVRQFVSEWCKGDRNFDEIQLHVDKVYDNDFLNSFNPDISDPKRIKIRRNDRRATLYIERDRLATRHLSIRCFDLK